MQLARSSMVTIAVAMLLSPAMRGHADSDIDFTHPVENLAHNPDAKEPANPRNLLTRRFDAAWLKSHLATGTDWVPYPTIDDRAAWQHVPASIREAILATADSVKGKSWEPLTATMALAYWRTGDRGAYGNRAAERQSRLQKLVLGELCRDDGKLLDPITDAIWMIAEETYWGQPVHIPQMQRTGPGLPNVEEPTIELSAAERGAAFAWTLYLLGNRLDSVSPFVRQRIRGEVERRVVTPFLTRNDFWWMGLAERKDLNNWTPWILSNVLTCVLLVEDDPDRRVAAVDKALHILDRYLNRCPADGGCDEGPHYWEAASGATFDCLELLHAATKGALDIYDEPLIRNMAHFICAAHVAGEWTLNYGDGSAHMHPNSSLLYRFGGRTHDADVMKFGAWIAHHEKSDEALSGNLGRQLPAIYGHDALAAAPEAEPLAREVYLPDLQMIAAREHAGDTRGMYFGIRGYFNAKSHNHNDAGSFMLYANGEPVLIDVGVEAYTAKTFSAQRYDIWTMQSAYHNLPTINGQMERWGSQFHVSDVSCHFDEAGAWAEMDLASAYPADAAVETWRRKLELRRGYGVVLTETYQLKTVQAPLVLNFMTACAVETTGPGQLTLITRPERGAADTASNRVVLSYDVARVKPHIEELPMSDHGMRAVWGNTVRRIQFIAEQPPASDQLVFEFKFASP
jgi:hypothetical protein